MAKPDRSGAANAGRVLHRYENAARAHNYDTSRLLLAPLIFRGRDRLCSDGAALPAIESTPSLSRPLAEAGGAQT